MQTGTCCLESLAELLPKRNFGSTFLCPQNKTSLHHTAAAAHSLTSHCHPQRGSGIKSPPVSHSAMLALTLHLRSGLLKATPPLNLAGRAWGWAFSPCGRRGSRAGGSRLRTSLWDGSDSAWVSRGSTWDWRMRDSFIQMSFSACGSPRSKAISSSDFDTWNWSLICFC